MMRRTVVAGLHCRQSPLVDLRQVQLVSPRIHPSRDGSLPRHVRTQMSRGHVDAEMGWKAIDEPLDFRFAQEIKAHALDLSLPNGSHAGRLDAVPAGGPAQSQKPAPGPPLAAGATSNELMHAPAMGEDRAHCCTTSAISWDSTDGRFAPKFFWSATLKVWPGFVSSRVMMRPAPAICAPFDRGHADAARSRSPPRPLCQGATLSSVFDHGAVAGDDAATRSAAASLQRPCPCGIFDDGIPSCHQHCIGERRQVLRNWFSFFPIAPRTAGWMRPAASFTEVSRATAPAGRIPCSLSHGLPQKHRQAVHDNDRHSCYSFSVSERP